MFWAMSIIHWLYVFLWPQKWINMQLWCHFLSILFHYHSRMRQRRDLSIFRTFFYRIKSSDVWNRKQSSIVRLRSTFFTFVCWVEYLEDRSLVTFHSFRNNIKNYWLHKNFLLLGLDFCKQKSYYVHNNLRMMWWSFDQLVK